MVSVCYASDPGVPVDPLVVPVITVDQPGVPVENNIVPVYLPGHIGVQDEPVVMNIYPQRDVRIHDEKRCVAHDDVRDAGEPAPERVIEINPGSHAGMGL